MLKSNQVKPEVIGYHMVFYDGSMDDSLMSKDDMEWSTAQRRGPAVTQENGKQKFRPVYK